MWELIKSVTLWLASFPGVCEDPMVNYVELDEYSSGGCKVIVDAGSDTYEYVQLRYCECYDEVLWCLGQPLSKAKTHFDLKKVKR